MTTDKIKVAVRVRPPNRREIELGTQCVIEMSSGQTILYHPSSTKSEGKHPKTFAFDNCFWSYREEDSHYASQETVYKSLGVDILDNAFQGYNACIFAYGQTGSGKSYTMMGTLDNKGLIPRMCDALFERIACNTDPVASYKVEVSYMEIYNEKVHDLLDPKGSKNHLRVREHNILGPYVDGLSKLAVSSYEEINNLMTEGNKSRTVAATNMNSESSRSHAVFNITLTCSLTDLQSGVSGEKVSKMSLVDLAGSERAVKTGAVGERLKEGSNINKSLTTLGLVISKLADQSSGKSKDSFVPYRDSVLTWLLRDNLGGNSKTVMVATISPASDNYEETLSTLRYADRAKRIVNHAVVNEDPNARIIRELREEVEMLREQLLNATQQDGLNERLRESEQLMKEMSQTWEEKLRKTEKVHQDRQQALEKMGISVQASGIKVETDKYYLVNLNADPSLNELLVYYMKERTLVGRSDAPSEQDIQLSGLGIMPEHCIITIEDAELYIMPIEGARTCVNGNVITEKNQLKHGDRLLWGNNHFFRVNCPKANTPISEVPERPIDYEFAREEIMMKELSNDPIQSAMKSLEKQHETDKHNALEKQRQMYERQLQMLRNQMSPSTPYAPYSPYDPLGLGKMTPSGLPSPSVQSKMEKWAKERDELFKKSLAKLREDIIKANALVREANFLAEEMGKQTEFKVTLQIPAANLSPNRKRSAFVSEPAILVKRKIKGSQVWSMEKLENKIIDMREMYEERKEKNLPLKDDIVPKGSDPFYESQENHNLIGVANVFLEVLFHNVRLNYHVPIISQQGEVAGRLHVEIGRIAGTMPERYGDAESLRGSLIDLSGDNDDTISSGKQIVVRVSIRDAAGLPPSLSHFVFCQYTFWSHSDPVVVAPIVDQECATPPRKGKDNVTFVFDHAKDFEVNLTEEFLEHCAEGALSIEVWGHRSTGFTSTVSGWEVSAQSQQISHSLVDRWAELKRKLELWMEIHELNEQGEYAPVEVLAKPDVATGGVFQLRQGQQRRICVKVKPVHNSGTLPIICESIHTISIGGICARSKLQKPLDSYQEEDLSLLREKWNDALMRRREYLDEHIQKIIKKENKSDEDAEREQNLIDQWVCLTEEKNTVLAPVPGSDIPGAPANWDPPHGMEKHVPVIFLDLNDDMSMPNSSENGIQVAGGNSILPKEHGSQLFNLPIVKNCEKDVCAIAAWDSSIHDSIHLNAVTPPNERVYLILKVSVRLSHPAIMDLILRKRFSINVYKKQSITEKIKKRITRQDVHFVSGVIYEIVASIPKASEDPEGRESLALMAASGGDAGTSDGESYIEKYTRGVSAVESILTLDRLRQEVAVKELLAAQGRPLRKTASVPNISHVLHMESSSSKLDDQLRADSACNLTSGSLSDGLDRLHQCANTFKDVISEGKNAAMSGLASPLSGLSPQPTKFVKPMRTVIEEQTQREVQPLLDKEEEEESGDEGDKKCTSDKQDVRDSHDEEFTEFESYWSSNNSSKNLTVSEETESKTEEGEQKSLQHSGTCESIAEYQTKAGTPSVVSSGYGSQALSTTPLSSEDSGSLHSVGADDASTPDTDNRPASIKETLAPAEKAILDEPEVTEETTKSVEKTSTNAVEKTSTNAVEETSNEDACMEDKTKEKAVPELSTCSKEDLLEDTCNSVGNTGTVVEEMASENKPCPIECTVIKRRNFTSSNVAYRQSYPAAVVSRNEEQDYRNALESFQIPTEVETTSVSSQEDPDDANSEGSGPDNQSFTDVSLPSWLVVGESISISPYSKTGVVSYIGPTEFSSGTWVGIELDTPTGRNDGSVNGVRYFQCKPRFGIFIRPDKLVLDKRGRAVRANRNTMSGSSLTLHSRPKTDGSLRENHLSQSTSNLNSSRMSKSMGSTEIMDQQRGKPASANRSKTLNRSRK